MLLLNFPIVTYILFLDGILNCYCSRILFYEAADFKGITDFKADTSPKCKATPAPLTGSMRTSECVAIFKSGDCSHSGYIILTEVKDLANFDQEEFGDSFAVNSFRSCTELEDRPQLDIDFHLINGKFSWGNGISDQEGQFSKDNKRFRDVCTCGSISGSSNITGNAHGNCFTVHKRSDCSDAPMKTIKNALDFKILQNEVTIKPCGLSLSCSKIKVTVINIEPEFKLSNLVGSERAMSISTKHTYINNGPATMEDVYKVKQEITETAEFEFSSALRKAFSTANGVEMGFSNGSTNTSNSGWAFDVTAGLSGTIPKKNTTQPPANTNGTNTTVDLSLSGKYQWSAFSQMQKNFQSSFTKSKRNDSESNVSNMTKHTVETKRTFEESKKILIPPCTKYEFTSNLKMTDGVYVTYFVSFEITGETLAGKKLKTKEIREILDTPYFQSNGADKLSFLDSNENSDKYTLSAVTSALLKASYGLESTIIGVGEDLSECLKKYQHSVCS